MLLDLLINALFSMEWRECNSSALKPRGGTEYHGSQMETSHYVCQKRLPFRIKTLKVTLKSSSRQIKYGEESFLSDSSNILALNIKGEYHVITTKPLMSCNVDVLIPQEMLR